MPITEQTYQDEIDYISEIAMDLMDGPDPEDRRPRKKQTYEEWERETLAYAPDYYTLENDFDDTDSFNANWIHNHPRHYWDAWLIQHSNSMATR